MQPIPITDKIKLIPGKNNASFPYANCLLIEDEVRVLIDTGAGKEQLQLVEPHSINYIINSHCHFDHVVGNRLFPQAKVWAHALDAPPMRSVEHFIDLLGFRAWPKLMGTNDNLQVTRKGEVFWISLGHNAVFRYQTSPVHYEFNDGQVFHWGEVELQIVHTPGHTPGHCAFYFPKEKIVFSGDIDVSDWGPFYGNLRANLDDFIISIQKVISLKPALLLTSHHEPVTAEVEAKLIKYLNRIYEREEKILKLLKKPRTINEIAAQNIFYRRHLDDRFVFWEKMMICKHLMRLQKQNKIVQRGESYLAIS
ncbi:MAG: MBL fold metallo-hydrolase [Firmicutes bacterium]|nr:MBL fold metallo-hydrolase [Bacillota bacterium]